MKIIGSRWTPKYNELQIKCVCGYEFWTRADRWVVRCPVCQHRDGLDKIRERIEKEDFDGTT